MDTKLFLTALVTVFLAELGDKTQLSVMALTSSSSSKWAVFLGASLALILASGMAVLLGDVISRYVSPPIIQRGAGTLFLILGVLYLRNSFSH